MILAELRGTIALAAPTSPSLLAEVSVRASPPGGLLVEVSIDSTVGLAARPQKVQVAGFAVFLDGQQIPLQSILPSLQVDLTLDNIVSQWSLSVPVPSPFGEPSIYYGAPPGRRRIDLYGVYLTTSGAHLIPLVLNGIVAKEQRSLEVDGSRIAILTGADAGGRYDRQRITFALPPGHGLSRSQIVATMAARIAIPTSAVTGGHRMDHPIQLVDAEWIPTSKELMALEGRTLIFDETGGLATPIDGWDPGKPVDFIFSRADLLRAARTTLDSKGDVVTRIIATGNAQVTSATQARHTTVEVIEITGPYAPKVQGLLQLPDGTLEAITPPDSTSQERLISRVTTTREYDGTTLLSETIVSEQWYNLVSARYIQQADGSLGYVQNLYVGAGAVKDDTTPAHVWPGERFVPFGRSETIYTYDSRGYLVLTTQRKDQPMLGKADLKSRANGGVAWSAASFTFPRFLLADKSGAIGLQSEIPNSINLGQEVIPNPTRISAGSDKSIETIAYEVDDLGLIHRQTKTLSIYWAPEGTTHLYVGGKEFAVDHETLAPSSIEVTSFSASKDEAGHTETIVSTTLGGPATTKVSTGLQGYLPAAAKLANLMPSASAYTDPAQAALLGRAASPFQNQPIRAKWISYALESGHSIYESVASNQWAENPEELRRWAQWLIREGAAADFQCLLPANFLIRRGSRIQLAQDVADALDLRLPAPVDVFVRRVSHRLSSVDGPLLTTVTGRIYYATA